MLHHIANTVPVEDFAYKTILTAIESGSDTPGLLDSALLVAAPPDPARSFSPSFLSSQRSGAVSRMCDLKLIRRNRVGVKVTYVVTDLGRRYNACEI